MGCDGFLDVLVQVSSDYVLGLGFSALVSRFLRFGVL